jgi:hypothetical protein
MKIVEITQIVDFKDDACNVAHTLILKEEKKLIEAGFQYVRYSERDEVAICKQPK